MPTQEKVFADIISAVEAGAKSVGRELEQSARDAIKERYFDWIVKPGTGDDGKPVETPQDVWDGPDGEKLRGKFQEIGRGAAQAAGEEKVDDTQTNRAALGVEAGSDCPWCRTA